MTKKLLIIGSVWPEPNSSAAGSRMLQLLHVFLNQSYQIIFASSAVDSEYRYPLEDLGVELKSIVLNNESFDRYITELEPEIVLFDRFITEEQFGWRVEKHSPNSLRVLDTEDLHCLRKGRQQAFAKNRNFVYSDLNSDTAKREIASIYRSDLTLMISKVEMELLRSYFKLSDNLLCYVPFLLDKVSDHTVNRLPKFEERFNFVTIGSFRHDPNWDSVLYLKKEIWPILRKKMPNVEMHVYGSYPSEKAMQLNNPKENFFIKGWINDASEALKKAKLLLAPLRFGAGLKGKFIDAMLNGTPSVTTPLGAEAMHGELEWGGAVASGIEELVSAAVAIYTQKETWEASQKKGFEILNSCYSKEVYSKELLTNIKRIQENLEHHRSNNFIGSMLLFHTMRSTEFMSRWIEEKNK